MYWNRWNLKMNNINCYLPPSTSSINMSQSGVRTLVIENLNRLEPYLEKLEKRQFEASSEYLDKHLVNRFLKTIVGIKSLEKFGQYLTLIMLNRARIKTHNVQLEENIERYRICIKRLKDILRLSRFSKVVHIDARDLRLLAFEGWDKEQEYIRQAFPEYYKNHNNEVDVDNQS
jgi:hypothetical protein